MNNSSNIHLVRVFSIFLLLLLSLSDFAFAQEKYSVFGRVKIENGSLENTRISILKNAEKMSSSLIDGSGKFEYELDFGNEYILEFSKEGFVTKKVSISTFVPLDILSRDNQFPPFKFMVSLFPAYEGLDLSVFDQPMGMIMYDKELDDFDYDRDYDSQIRDAIKKAEEEARRRAAELEAQRMATERAYRAALQRGDSNLRSKNYDVSKSAYTEALTIRPEEEYPKAQLLKLEGLMNQDLAAAAEAARLAAEEKALEEKYMALIVQADNYLAAINYELSKETYTKALELKENEAYPKNQIQKINDLLLKQKAEAEETARLAAEQKTLDDKYATIISLADSQFSSGDYTSAKSSYSDALSLKAEEAYPKSQIQKIDALLGQQQAAADEAARLAAEEKALADKYASLISQADSQFSSEEYASAKSSYSDALSLKAEEAYPKSQIQKIDALLAQQQAAADEAARLAAEEKALADKYASLISQADSQFSSEEYASAKSSYSDALSLKAEEAYPKSQIQKIDALLAQQQAAADEAARLAAEEKALADKYASIISLADSQFISGDYASAKSSYSDALSLKAEEAYPKSQIQKIDDLLAQQQAAADEAVKQKALADKYASIISLADSQFSSGDYISAKSSYSDALSLKAEEAYPKSQIQKIDALLAQQQAAADEAARLAGEQKALADKYVSLISQADSQFSSEEYASAKSSYSDALSLKAEEAYPKSQIQKIDALLAQQQAAADEAARLAAEQKALADKYASIISQADSQYASKEYGQAKTTYGDALNLKAEEVYPKSQIEKIDEILANLERQAEIEARLAAEKKALDEKYALILAQADAQFEAEDYQAAKMDYLNALELKSNEIYPKSQIQKIEDIILEQARKEQEQARLAAQNKVLDEKYNAFIVLADSQFSSESYESAKNNYELAIEIRKEESYPQDQVRKINEIMQKLQAKADEEARIAEALQETERSYRNHVDLGDEFFKRKKWQSAIQEYEMALQAKPGEIYPSNQIAEINKIVDELARQEKEKSSLQYQYAALIAEADEFMNQVDYSAAARKYQGALDLKPEESYPKNQLKRIEVLRERQRIADRNQKEIDQKYAKEIEDGEKYLREEQFSVARHHFKAALTIKPGEVYPQEKLDEIAQRIAALKSAEEDDLANNPANFDKKLSITWEREYAEMIAMGDDAFEVSHFSVAKVMFERALVIFEREYPKKKLKEIDKLIREGKDLSLTKEYHQLIARADAELTKENYSVAKFYYQKARNLNASEKYPEKQMEKIEELIDSAKNQKIEAEYKSLIDQADEAFDKGNYSVARFYYRKAKLLKSDESYPKERLKLIQSEQSKK
jgi:flavodoxin